MPPRLTTWWLDRQEEALKTKRKTRSVQSEMSKIRSAGDNKNKKQQKRVMDRERERKKKWKLVTAATECVNNKKQINSVTRNTFTVKTALQLLNRHRQRRRQSHKATERRKQTHALRPISEAETLQPLTVCACVSECGECERVYEWLYRLSTWVRLARQLLLPSLLRMHVSALRLSLHEPWRSSDNSYNNSVK